MAEEYPTMTIEAESSSETLVTIYHTTSRHIPEANNHYHTFWKENFLHATLLAGPPLW
jgi:hypothetical protein